MKPWWCRVKSSLLLVVGANALQAFITTGPPPFMGQSDPVRFVGNRSSGKMGYALAAALRELGAEVTLVSGPVVLPAPPGVLRVSVETALEMHAAVMARVEACDLFAAAAAVADYRPQEVHSEKLKKQREQLQLSLVRNPDILAEVAALPRPPFTLGFAAETQDLPANAATKLRQKGLDLVAANRVGGGEGGFESERNALSLLWQGGGQELAMAPKMRLARELARVVAERYRLARAAA